MKGTIFSADFVFDNSGNARLLEINTDTDLINNATDNHLDLSAFGNIISGSTFNEVHIIYKPMQNYLVSRIESYISDNISNITTVTKQMEDNCAVYLEAVEDTDAKFILRLAYDEAAVLDSSYAKSELNLYSLFNTYNDIQSVVPVYISSSQDGYINNITSSFNSSNLPDFVTKTEDEGATVATIEFIKLGLPETGSDYRIQEFLSSTAGTGVAITNFLPNLSGSKVESFRSMQLVYGPDLDLAFLGGFKQLALFEVPTLIVTGSDLVNSVHKKHHYEFATNHPKGIAGIKATNNLISSSGELVNIQTAATGSGSSYQSYYVSGSPDSDDYPTLAQWFYSGSTFPSGSHVSSSIIAENYLHDNDKNILRRIELESGDVFYLGGLAIIPRLESGVVKWKVVDSLEVGQSLFDTDGSTSTIVSSSTVISDTALEYETASPNMENIDTYVVKGTNRNLLMHNPFGAGRYSYGECCFLAGTKISTPNGEVDIEDIEVGDFVNSYNVETESYTEKEVTAIDHEYTVGSHKDACLNLGYEGAGYISLIANGEDLDIKFTPEHPFLTKNGWAALAPLVKQEPWASQQEEVLTLKVGDEILIDGEWSAVEGIGFALESEDTPVYNFTVEGTHTYIANKIVVHNK
jgi:hypothetical protein